MPYIIDRPFKRGVAAIAACCAGIAAVAGVAAAPATAATPSCSPPALTQPFLPFGDSNEYALPGGERFDNFNGSGWTLSGGASIQTTTLADGTSGHVLNLPSGSEAVSPVMCVNSSYPTARTMVQNVAGAEGVQFYVAYEGTNNWGNPQNTGQVHGSGTAWTLSDPVNIQPSNVSGWQLAQFTFIPGGQTSDFRIYNFYVDPYSR